jgi:hypothetical protein
MGTTVQLVTKVVCVEWTPSSSLDVPPQVLWEEEAIIVDFDKPLVVKSTVITHPDPAPPHLLPDMLAVS